MDSRAELESVALPAIPLIDTGPAGPTGLLDSHPERLAAIVADGRAHYGDLALKIGDALSKRWLERNASPYLAEIERTATAIDRPGAYLLNLSFEWTCTAGVGPDPEASGNRLLRTLDWPLDGLGRNLVVARHDTAAGPYFNVTWPGFMGCVTAMAPGRFSAAINQPPMRRWTPSCWLDWVVNRTRLWRRRTLPPLHLLRRAFESCRTYEEAKAMLGETSLAMPAFISLSGIDADQGCIIERYEDGAAVRESPASAANHWVAVSSPGRARGIDSEGRWRMMEAVRDTAAGDLSWVAPPILNPTTRLAVVANAAAGTLVVRGYETDGPATAEFRL